MHTRGNQWCTITIDHGQSKQEANGDRRHHLARTSPIFTSADFAPTRHRARRGVPASPNHFYIGPCQPQSRQPHIGPCQPQPRQPHIGQWAYAFRESGGSAPGGVMCRSGPRVLNIAGWKLMIASQPWINRSKSWASVASYEWYIRIGISVRRSPQYESVGHQPRKSRTLPLFRIYGCCYFNGCRLHTFL